MHIETIGEAIQKGVCLELQYDGYSRVVECHACGYTKDGNPVARVWQVAGGSASGEPIGWKLLRLDEAWAAHLTGHRSNAPRPGYRRNDSAMARIIYQV